MSTFQNDLSRDEFYRKVIEPDFPNVMQFALDVPPERRQPGRSFSEDGVETVTQQMKDFVLARVLGTWSKTKQPPYEMTVTVDIAFRSTPLSDLREGLLPWYALVDQGNNPLEGSHRPSKGQR